MKRKARPSVYLFIALMLSATSLVGISWPAAAITFTKITPDTPITITPDTPVTIAPVTPITGIISVIPTVTGISPDSGPTTGGTKVTITGTNFTGATAVNLGSAAATGVTVTSSTSITATSPAGSAGAVNVTVVTPKGVSATNSNDQFTYTALLPAVISKNTVSVNGASILHNGPSVIHFQIGSTNFDINSKPQSIDAAPVIINERTFLPLKYVAGPLGATTSWDAVQKMVTVTLGSKTIQLWIGQGTAKVNGVPVLIDPGNPEVTPLIVNERTMLPIAFIAKNLGCQVGWNGSTQEVTLTVQDATGSTVALSTLPQGITVNLAGYTWIILDPSTGYLLMQDAYDTPVPFDSNSTLANFDPGSSTNIGFVCKGVYAAMSPADQAMIQPHNWTTGDNKHDTDPVPAVYDYVGLLSYDEYNQYKNVTGVNTNFNWWLRTPMALSPDGTWVWYLNSTDGPRTLPCKGVECVRPAIYVNPDMQLIVSGYSTQ